MNQKIIELLQDFADNQNEQDIYKVAEELRQLFNECPFGLDKIHCQNCAFSKENLCDYPYIQNILKQS